MIIECAPAEFYIDNSSGIDNFAGISGLQVSRAWHESTCPIYDDRTTGVAVPLREVAMRLQRPLRSMLFVNLER